MRRADFAGAYGERMYCLVMAIRAEALPTDAAALTEMVLALDAENEKLRVAMQTLKEMIFGKRSERDSCSARKAPIGSSMTASRKPPIH